MASIRVALVSLTGLALVACTSAAPAAAPTSAPAAPPTTAPAAAPTTAPAAKPTTAPAAAATTAPAAALTASDVGVTKDAILIGGTDPLSGPAAAYGTIAKASDAYFHYVNDNGGVNGRSI